MIYSKEDIKNVIDKLENLSSGFDVAELAPAIEILKSILGKLKRREVLKNKGKDK